MKRFTAEWVSRNPDLIFAAGAIGVLFLALVPLPTPIIDLLLVATFAGSLLLLLTVGYVRESAAFSSFPSVLLLATAGRVALSLATTRLILTRAREHGTSAAGDVIRAFGEFVAGSEPVIGFVLFLILVIVNFVVITKGAHRVSEVSARFMLDALPGKQLAIDADLAARRMDEGEARRRREAIAREADFYGAMDGATRFIRGDAVAGILITLVNIGGGLALGILRYGMAPGEAWRTYAILTIGDGLVTQIPAVLVSLAAGLLVTRGQPGSDLGRQVARQLFSERRALVASAVGVLLLAVAGLPLAPLLLTAGVLLAAAWFAGSAVPSDPPGPAAPSPKPADDVEDRLRIESLELEIAPGLLRPSDSGFEARLLEAISEVRRGLALELGILVPAVRVRDGLRLGARGCALRIRGAIVERGEIPASATDIVGSLASYLRRSLRRRADELLTRDDVDALLKRLKEVRPAIAEEVVPSLLRPAELQKVLQNLLREGVSIRDLGTILEALSDGAGKTKDPQALTERVRRALARTLCAPFVEGDGRAWAIVLDPSLEDILRAAADRGGESALQPETERRVAEGIATEAARLEAAGRAPVVLCAPSVRPQVREIVETVRPDLRVLSYGEILREVRVEALATVSAE